MLGAGALLLPRASSSLVFCCPSPLLQPPPLSPSPAPSLPAHLYMLLVLPWRWHPLPCPVPTYRLMAIPKSLPPELRPCKPSCPQGMAKERHLPPNTHHLPALPQLNTFAASCHRTPHPPISQDRNWAASLTLHSLHQPLWVLPPEQLLAPFLPCPRSATMIPGLCHTAPSSLSLRSS